MQSYIKLSWKIWLISNYNMIWICDDFIFQGPTPGADEMVGLLVNAGMYDKALTICQLFGMKLTSVFDSLALRYVYSCVSILVQYSAIKLSNIYVVQIIKLLKKHYLSFYLHASSYQGSLNVKITLNFISFRITFLCQQT